MLHIDIHALIEIHFKKQHVHFFLISYLQNSILSYT